MIFSGVTQAALLDALEVADYTYQNLCFTELEPTSGSGLRHKVRLGVVSLDGPGVRRGQPDGHRGGKRRRIRSACWHAHRDLFLHVFAREPEARIYTALATYRGLEGFKRDYPATGEQRIGGEICRDASGAMVILDHVLRDACTCVQTPFPHVEEFSPAAELYLSADWQISGVMPGQTREEG